ncbi:hypothetical protein ACEYYH_12235 [Microbacterium trichothecenolyticum]|uniref:hypothetical protein n=1 Tax=Microbacterium trichothecenolyticum TaxID=69370 RepID=UPI0035BE4D7B
MKNVDTPREGSAGGRHVTRVAIAVVLGLVISSIVATPANAAWVAWHQALVAANIWKWSGHHTSTGAYVEAQNTSAEVYAIKSESSTIYGGHNYISLTWSSSYASVACRHGKEVKVLLYCASNR